MQTDKTQTMSILVYVTYQGTVETRFDRAYYVSQHLPRVMEAWRQYGLESVAAFFPGADHTGTIAICECRFASEAAMRTSFSSPESVAVMADIVQFTDVQPARFRAMPLV